MLLIVASVTCLSAFAAGQVIEEVVARVNSQIITLSEFQRSKDQLKDDVKQQDAANADKLFSQREKDILRDLIDQQLLLENCLLYTSNRAKPFLHSVTMAADPPQKRQTIRSW